MIAMALVSTVGPGLKPLKRVKALYPKAKALGFTAYLLSTTLAQPRSFFAALTGILEREIDVVVPRPGDRRRHGAEHIVFVRAWRVVECGGAARRTHTERGNGCRWALNKPRV